MQSIVEQTDINVQNMDELNSDSIQNNILLSRAVIEENKKIKLVDSDESNGLDLFCYTSCDVSDSELVKRCRGVVFNKDELIMKGFPFTVDVSSQNKDSDILLKIKDMFSECKFYESYEGSLIRMFYYKNKWYITTHRKLDAFKSKWASKTSFGEYFREALEYEEKYNVGFQSVLSPKVTEDEDIIKRLENILDKEKQYMFLLISSKENRIVCAPPSTPTLLHVGTFYNNELKTGMDQNLQIAVPKELFFDNIDELLRFVDNSDFTFSQGVIVFAPNNSQYKILSPDYDFLFKVRGNEPSIKFRYLQIRMDKNMNKSLRELYPDMVDTFDNYENILYSKAKDLYKSYVDRFIKHTYITVPSDEYSVIKQCHSWHMENRDKNKINLNKVIEFLNTQQPTILNRLIKEVLNPKKDNGVQQKPESTQKTVYKKPHSTNDGFIPVVNKKFKKQPHQSLLKYNKQETKPKNE
jgi:hypothetical protein